jgi:hypothetical protein
MSDSHYRKYTEAQVYVSKLKEALAAEIGDKTELVTIRGVVSQAKADADAVFARVNGGENLGSVAQTESADLASRQKDGLFEPEPERLLPDAVRLAIADKPAGDELFGPIEVSGTFWVFRIDNREPDALVTETQKGQLADLAISDAVKAKRPSVKIDLNMSNSDYDWVNDHVGK